MQKPLPRTHTEWITTLVTSTDGQLLGLTCQLVLGMDHDAGWLRTDASATICNGMQN